MFGHKSYLKINGGVNRGLSGKLSDYLKMAGVEGYELFHCDYEFYQELDAKGKANSEVRGGQIRVVLDTLPTEELIVWALSRDKRHSGEIGLCGTNASDGVVEKLKFENGLCTTLNLSFTDDGSAFVKTLLVITAEIIKLGNNGKLDKDWTTDN
jgi:hypothetical protein